MKCLSLFSGAGGGDLAAQHLLGFETVGYVEWNKYCQRVLAQRIEDGFLNEAPIFGDIDEFVRSGAAKKYQGFVDVLTAGFPCQPFSVAGKKRGQDDDRNKWPQTLQCIRDVRPRYALLENVPGLLNSGYFGEILSSLAEIGFDARWCVLGADDVGAPHRRKRLWILAYPKHERPIPREHEGRSRSEEGVSAGVRSDVADSEDIGFSGALQRQDSADQGWGELAQVPIERGSSINYSGQWSTEPDVGRVANGVAHRVDRLKALGNGQVPRVAATAWRILND